MDAGTVILAARDRHKAFDRNNNPDAVALRYLTTYVTTLHGKIARIDETALVIDDIVTMPLVDFDAGITVPANRRVVGMSYLTSTSKTGDIDIIPWAHRFDRNQPMAAAWEYGGKLFLRAPVTSWNGIAEIGVSYIPVPATLTKLTDVLALPDTALDVCVEKTALFMARRGHTDPAIPPIDVRTFLGAASEAEDNYLDEVRDRVNGRMFRTRDTWPS